MDPLPIFISVVVLVLAMSDWRRGLIAVLFVGVLQDVLRKLTEGTPTYFLVWSLALYLAVAGFALLANALPSIRMISVNDDKVRKAWGMFGLLIALQMVNATFRYGNPVIAVFGAIFYLGPVLAILLGYAFADGPRRIRWYLIVYLLIMVPTCLTVYLSPDFQDAWPVLRDIGSFKGKQLLIYDVGTVLKSYSGILRVGEIAAWHAGTACMFLLVLIISHRSTTNWFVSIILASLLIGVIILTGRRKMLMALSIFTFAQWALMARFQRGVGKLSVLILLLGTVASFAFTLLEPASEGKLYLQRSATVYGDAAGRAGLSVDLMKSAFNQSSGLGLGAGISDVGGRYAGVKQTEGVMGATESGLGKLMIELGLLGIICISWLLIVIALNLLRNLEILAALDKKLFYYQVAFLSFLFANAVTFSVATQVYSDYFILTIIGTIAGFAFRINSVAARAAERRNVNYRQPSRVETTPH